MLAFVGGVDEAERHEPSPGVKDQDVAAVGPSPVARMQPEAVGARVGGGDVDQLAVTPGAVPPCLTLLGVDGLRA